METLLQYGPVAHVALAVIALLTGWICRKIASLSSRGEVVFFNCEKQIVNVSKDAASSFILDVANLPSYEQKVHSSRVISRPDEQASKPDDVAAAVASGKPIAYELSGGWCCYPWTASFLLKPSRNGGFHSRVIPLRSGYTGITMNAMSIHGGFALRTLGPERTLVTHYESYRWNRHFALLRFPPLYRFMARWHQNGMAVEMKAVKVGMEAAAARGSSRPPSSLETFLLRSHLTVGRFISQEMSGVAYSLPEPPASLLT